MKWKNIVCAVLAGFLGLMCGCGRANPEPLTETSGRYIETEITPPATNDAAVYALGVFPGKGGTLDYVAIRSANTEQLVHYRSGDFGESWEAVDVSWYDEIAEKYGDEMFLSAATVASDGAVHCVLAGDSAVLAVRHFQGVTSQVELESPSENQGRLFVLDCCIYAPDSIGILCETDQRYFNLYDMNTGTLKQQQNVGFDAFSFFDGGYAYVAFSPEKQFYELYQRDLSGKETARIPVNYNAEKEYALCGREGRFFLRTENDITELTPDSDPHPVLDAAMYLCGSPSWQTVRLQYQPDSDTFYMVQKNRDDGTERLYRYTYDAGLQSVPSNELTVFSLYDNETLRQTITIFRAQHPDWTVKKDIGMSPDSAVTKDDAIRILNTELLAKKGADVYLLDGLVPETYIEKGVFADLSQIAASDDFFQNIASAYSNKNGVCAIPARFKIPALLGEKGFVDSLTDLPRVVQAAQQAPARPDYKITRRDRLSEDQRPLGLVNLQWDLVKLFISTYQPVILNADGMVNETALSELLSSTKAISDCDWSPNAGYLEGDDAIDWEIVSFLPSDVYGGRSLLGIANISDFKDFSNWALSAPLENGSKFVSPEFYLTSLCGPTQKVFLPTTIMAVNDYSQQKEIAMEFIKTALSQDVQQPSYSEGFPVNRDAFRATLSDSIGSRKICYDVDMEAFASSLTTPVTIDETILEVVIGEVKPYYNGEQTLETAVSNICGKLRTYLAEKS